MPTTTNLDNFVINYLTQAQYDAAKANNTLNENQLYLTPPPTTLAGYGITDSAGSATKPIYLNNGAPTECSDYAGGTAVTLNGTSKAASTASFYAPTDSGTSGYILESKGASAAPDWIEILGVTHGGTGFKTASYKNAIITGNASDASGTLATVRTNNGALYASAQDATPTFGTLPVAQGGTGLTTTTNVNAVVIGNSTSATSALQTVATAQGAFYSSGTNAKPQFGTLPVNCGGTGVSTIASGEVLIGSGTSGIVTRAIKNMTAKNHLTWTSANTDNTIVTTNTLAYWNGRYNSTSSNLEYCNKGAFGDMATKTASDYIAKAIGTAKGDIIYWSSASTPARLAIGTAGHFLKATANGPAYSALTSTEITTALGFTPYNSTNPNGYISSYTETDPVFTASAAAGITSTDITNWNAKTSNTGTVTSVGISNATNGGLTVTSSPVTTSGTISVGHTNVLTNAQTTQAVYPIKIDKNGHISAYGSAVTIGTMAAQSSGSYVLKAGDSMTGSLTIQAAGDTYVWVKNTSTGNKVWLDAGGSANHGIWSDGYYNNSTFTSSGKWIIYRSSDGEAHTGMKLYGAVWNDYAEYRICKEKPEPGRCIVEAGDDTLVMSTDRMQPGAEIVSDTFGFAIGQTEEALTPVATSGRVLAYIYEGREAARAAIGKPVCSGPNGTVSIMTDEEYKEKAYCAIGTISAVPDYEEWGSDNIKVNNRIWVRVK